MEDQGVKTVLMGPAHPPYQHFIPAPGHQLGFNDLKIIEAHELLNRIAGKAVADHRLRPGPRDRGRDPRDRALASRGTVAEGGVIAA